RSVDPGHSRLTRLTRRQPRMDTSPCGLRRASEVSDGTPSLAWDQVVVAWSDYCINFHEAESGRTPNRATAHVVMLRCKTMVPSPRRPWVILLELDDRPIVIDHLCGTLEKCRLVSLDVYLDEAQPLEALMIRIEGKGRDISRRVREGGVFQSSEGRFRNPTKE